MPDTRLDHSLLVLATQAYVKQNALMLAIPPRVPIAAWAANSGPRCRTRMIDTGPEVSGKPMSQPLTDDPHLRPARVTSAIRSGVNSSLRTRSMEVSVSMLWPAACVVNTPVAHRPAHRQGGHAK
jgi:hypothetical protein